VQHINNYIVVTSLEGCFLLFIQILHLEIYAILSHFRVNDFPRQVELIKHTLDDSFGQFKNQSSQISDLFILSGDPLGQPEIFVVDFVAPVVAIAGEDSEELGCGSE
jgi:hypothetical protein